MSAAQVGDVDTELRRRLALRMLSFISIGILLFGAVTVFVALSSSWWAPIGIGGIIFLAAASVGGAFGFLFAVPRVLAQDSGARDLPTNDVKDGAAQPTTAQAVAKLKTRLLQSNTNLERVSDWLTTMLVGVGLSQLGSIDSSLSRFRDFLATYARAQGPLCATRCSSMLPAIGPMVLVFGLVMGFLALYIYTRLVLVTLFNEIEKEIDDVGDLEASLQDAEASEAVVDAARTLETNNENPAYKGLVTSDDPSVGQSLSVMFNLLYRPGKWQDVIDLGSKLSATPATKRPEYWFYLAAAFGQKLAYLIKNEAAQDDIASARANALDCARRAADADPLYRDKLWNISKPGSVDDDLAELRTDPAFLAITGMTGHEQ